jgi:hypothetical protein
MGMITGWARVDIPKRKSKADPYWGHEMWNNWRAMLLDNDNRLSEDRNRGRNWVEIRRLPDGRWQVRASSFNGYDYGHPQSSKEKARAIAMKFMRKYPLGHPWGQPLTKMPKYKKGMEQK